MMPMVQKVRLTEPRSARYDTGLFIYGASSLPMQGRGDDGVRALEGASGRDGPLVRCGRNFALTGAVFVKPVLQALVLAERVYEDVSGKKIIAGTFNAIEISPAPAIVEKVNEDGETKHFLQGGSHGGSPYAYISLTDVYENTTLELQFVSLTRNLVIFQTELTVGSSDRLETVEIVLPLPLLPVREAGVYAFEIVCEGEIIGSHRITVHLAQN